jgi:putative tricarboxylic transport membrane protein
LTTKSIDRVFAVALLFLGLYIVWNAVRYGYMRGTTPGPGFFPLWVGLGLTVLSAVNIIRNVSGAEILESAFDRAGLYKALAIFSAIVVFILLTPFIGMLTGAALLIPGIAFVIRPRWTATFALTIVAIAVVFPVACHFLFAVYLQVPLVQGPFGF